MSDLAILTDPRSLPAGDGGDRAAQEDDGATTDDAPAVLCTVDGHPRATMPDGSLICPECNAICTDCERTRPATAFRCPFCGSTATVILDPDDTQDRESSGDTQDRDAYIVARADLAAATDYYTAADALDRVRAFYLALPRQSAMPYAR